MGRRSRVNGELSAADLDEALGRIVLDRASVDEMVDWGHAKGYAISRSSWGRFMKEILDRWDEDQQMRLHARVVAQEFDAEGALGLSDSIGMLLQKKTLEVLANLKDGAQPDALLALARVVKDCTQARLHSQKYRDTKARARAEALAEMETEFRAELETAQPELWARLRQWFEQRAEQLAA
jgi:hypothetical protein